MDVIISKIHNIYKNIVWCDDMTADIQTSTFGKALKHAYCDLSFTGAGALRSGDQDRLRHETLQGVHRQ